MNRLAAVAVAVALMALPWPSEGQGCMVGDADEEGVQILGYFQPELEYQVNDEISVQLRLFHLAGDSDTEFGFLPIDTAAQVRVEYRF